MSLKGGMPLKAYVTIGDKAYRLDSLQGKRVQYGKQVCVTTPTEDGETFFVTLKSGDFCVVSQDFLFSTERGAKGIRVMGNKKETVNMRPLKKKHFPSLKCLSKDPSHAVAYMEQRLRKGEPIGYEGQLNDDMWCVFLHRHKFRLRPDSVLGIRALCELYGFNVTYDGGWYRLRYSRGNRSRIKDFSWFRMMGSEPLTVFSSINGEASRQGF